MDASPDVRPLQPFVEAVLEQVTGIAVVGGEVVDDGVVDQKPAHVTPEEAARARAVWVGRFVGVLVVHAMDSHPLHGRTLPAADAEDSQAVFQPAWAGEAPVRQQPMITDADAKPADEIEPANRPGQSRPAKQPRHAGQQGKQVKEDDASEDAKVDAYGAFGVENAQSPETAIDDTGSPQHEPRPPPVA